MRPTLSSKSDPKAGPAKRRGSAPDVFLYDWEGLRAFLDVARNRSLSAAAGRMRVQQATLSRRIKALEGAIGRPLLRRSPRGIELTPDGTELLGVLERFDEDLGAVGRWITRGVRGTDRPMPVNIACTEGLAAYWLTHFLPALRKRNVHACYNIHTTLTAQSERDRPFHATVQMSQPESAETSQQIGAVHFSAMASRAYVEDMGGYRAGDPPGRHRWIEYAPFRVLSGSWETWFGRQKIEIAPFTVTNSLVTTVNAVRESVGIALLPTYMAITMPDLALLDVGLRLKFPIWLDVDPASRDTPELSAAQGLLRAAIDPATMPWFGDKPVASPDFETWRGILKEAVRRLG